MDDRWQHRLSELPNQFILTRDSKAPFETWVSQPIGSFILHTHPNTRVRRFASGDDEALVIGVILARDGEQVTPENCPPGQFVTITSASVFSDASSLMPAFFDRSARRVASSLRLLAGPGEKPVRPELLHGSRPDWYWGPRTTFPRIDYLLPSQTLDLGSFEPKFRQLPSPSPLPAVDAAQRLESLLCDGFGYLAENRRRILLAMTGGIDSRTLFAAALKSGVEFETYTMVSPHVHVKDVQVAKEISERFGITHSVLQMGKLNSDELDWYLWFSAGLSVTLDTDFHAAGLWQRFGPDVVFVRGLGFTLGRDKYRDFLTDDDVSLFRVDPEAMWKRFTRPWVRRAHVYNRQAFESYADWFTATLDRSEMDFRDRLFLEQGMGSWDASAEHGIAATGTDRVSIANSTAVFELLLQARPGSKKSGPLQRDLIRAIEPSLLDYPFIKPTKVERLRYRALDTLRALRLRRRLRRLLDDQNENASGNRG